MSKNTNITNEYCKILNSIKTINVTDINRIKLILDTLALKQIETKHQNTGYTIDDIFEIYGKNTAFTSKINSFETLLKNLSFPIRDIISTFSYFILPISSKEKKYQIVFLYPEFDLDFNVKKSQKFSIKDEKHDLILKIDSVSIKKILMNEKVDAGLKTDGSFLSLLIKYPLTVISLVATEYISDNRKLIDLKDYFLNSLYKKHFVNRKVNSELLIESFLSQSIEEFKEIEILEDNFSIKLFKALNSYKNNVLTSYNQNLNKN